MNKNKYISQVVLLDAGGPLLFILGFHLFIGNFFIGLAEVIVVVKVFGIELKGLGAFLIILGNYVSMFVGYILVAQLHFIDKPDTFRTMIGPLSIMFVLSIFIEWVFFYYAIKRVVPNITIKKTTIITSVSQVVSYLLMVGYYFATNTNIIK